MTLAAFESVDTSPAIALRAVAMPWAVAALLPLPVLVATDPAASGDVSCLYLGMASAWLVTEFGRALGRPESLDAWRTRMLAIALAVATNVALFIMFAFAAGVRTQLPLPLMATLSAMPAVGMIPWLLRRVGHPYAAILAAALLVFAAKLVGCIAARIAYGPAYVEMGYVAADWRTAKLMITLLWSLSTAMSVGFVIADYHHFKRSRR